MFLQQRSIVAEPRHDLTLVFYDCEEVEAARQRARPRIERELPDWLAGGLSRCCGEPTGGLVEAGCQGAMRVEVRVAGARALGPVVEGRRRQSTGGPRCSGLDSREARPVGDRRVRVPRGAAGREDRRRGRGQRRARRCVVTVDFRSAPDRTVDPAEQHAAPSRPG